MSSRTGPGPLSRRLRDRNPISVPPPAASSSKPQLKKIIEPRIRSGCTEYLVSWVGRDKRSWLSADELKTLGYGKQINEFQTSLLGLNSKTINNSLERVKAVEGSSPSSKSKSLDDKKRKRIIHKPSNRRLPVCSGVSGFARNLDPLRILGATDAAGEIMFLMSWFGCDELDLVPAREANVKCPQVVINFYEGRMLPQHFLSEDENQHCGEGDNDIDCESPSEKES